MSLSVQRRAAVAVSTIPMRVIRAQPNRIRLDLMKSAPGRFSWTDVGWLTAILVIGLSLAIALRWFPPSAVVAGCGCSAVMLWLIRRGYSITRGTRLARIAFAIAMLGTMLGFGVLGTLIFGT